MSGPSVEEIRERVKRALEDREPSGDEDFDELTEASLRHAFERVAGEPL